MPQLEVFPSDAEQAEAAADLFVTLGLEALGARGRFRAALSGGRGPRLLFKHLAGRAQTLDWRKVELYWVDERWVEWKSPESNYGETRRLWLDSLKPEPLCFPMYRGPGNPEAAAEAYEALLNHRTGTLPPVLDLVFLGMGADGHTASLFPGQSSLTETKRSCLAVRHPATGQERLTLTLPALNAARNCVFLLSGAEKAAVLVRALKGDPELPAARVHWEQGDALWLADEAAAAEVPPKSWLRP